MNRLLSLLLLLVLGLGACKKGGDSPSAVVSISNVSQERGATATTFKFTVSLDKAINREVSMSYATSDGNAKAGTDYTAASGSISIPANATEATLSVTVSGDSIRRENQLFYVQLSNPVGCTFKTSKGTGTIVNENLTVLQVDNKGYTTPSTYPGMTLKWGDEFSGRDVNTNDWTFEIGNNNGWGNNELQYYTSRKENVFVSNGNLVIEARQESYGNKNYTSTRMITKGKQEFTFGRIDIRAKIPKGRGIWPALWMLGKNIDVASWPACGEIDIMENVGHEQSKVYGTLHWGNSFATHASKSQSYTLSSGLLSDEFHVYSCVWQQDLVKILIDDVQYFQLTKAEVSQNYPFNSDFFLIFNVAVGGNWPGNPDATTVFPQRMVVDYVRVFQ